VNDKNNFIARTQAWLSYLFVGGFFLLRFAEGAGLIAKTDDNTIVQALMLVLAFWFMRERGAKPEDTAPPGATSTTTTETVTTSPATTTVTTASAPVTETDITEGETK